MNIELLVAIATVVMAVLGGIVSAHAPTKPRQKWIYGIAFIVLGCAILMLVIFQSQLTEKTKQEARAAQETFNLKVEALKKQAEQITQTLVEMRPPVAGREHKKGELRPHVGNSKQAANDITEIERQRR